MLRVLKIFLIMAVVFLAGIAHADEKSADETSPAYITAEQLIEVNNYKGAIKAIKKAQKSGEDTVSMSLLLAEAYSGRVEEVGQLKKLGVAKKLKAALDHALELDPDNIEALRGLVQFHTQAPGIAGGDKAKALVFADKIIAIEPARGLVLKATLLAAQEEFDDAADLLEAAIKIEPDNPNIYLGRGHLHMRKEQYEQAIGSFETCLSIEPLHMDCLYQLGKTAQLGKVSYDKGIKSFNDLIAAYPERTEYLAYVHYRLGEIYRQQGDPQTAREHYQLSVDLGDLKPAKKALKALP